MMYQCSEVTLERSVRPFICWCCIRFIGCQLDVPFGATGELNWVKNGIDFLMVPFEQNIY